MKTPRGARVPLPAPLAPLLEVAMNLRWTWDRPTLDLFAWIDPELWRRAGHNPIKMLGIIPPVRLEELAADEWFIAALERVAGDLQSYLDVPPSELGTVAYFSPEFGLSESIPIYSGGLGVLAGDHLKAASDVGLPMVGVGLLYWQGYFHQRLDDEGWQQERYPGLDRDSLPAEPLTGPDGAPATVEVDLGGDRRPLALSRTHVGRVPLLLLECEGVTDRLYGGKAEHRLRQEIVLGIGGVRALQAAGYEPEVWHSNEGHAVFLALERIRRMVVEDGVSFDDALEATRATTIFTTHTPVPAGIDRYGEKLMRRYFGACAEECSVSFERLMDLGVAGGDRKFNMAVLGLRVAGRANGVSKLHGRVARAMFSPLWPGVPEDEVPITSVTNGVHAPSWLGPDMADVFGRVGEFSDDQLWQARNHARRRLVDFVRARLRSQLSARHGPQLDFFRQQDLAWTDAALDPEILTVGWARRFAPYKRATLLLSDLDRLRNLLFSEDRPMQVVIAGKAHPQDDEGKKMIREIVEFSSDPEVRTRVAFVEDYDMEIGRVLCQGADLWLNNPRRPLEASGTSGMKAALNGAINCSILDGWWDECYEPAVGWAIGTTEVSSDSHRQDLADAQALYELLEQEIIPSFYNRSNGMPSTWIARMRASIERLGPFITATRMVTDYVEQLYRPAHDGRKVRA